MSFTISYFPRSRSYHKSTEFTLTQGCEGLRVLSYETGNVKLTHRDDTLAIMAFTTSHVDVLCRAGTSSIHPRDDQRPLPRTGGWRKHPAVRIKARAVALLPRFVWSASRPSGAGHDRSCLCVISRKQRRERKDVYCHSGANPLGDEKGKEVRISDEMRKRFIMN